MPFTSVAGNKKNVDQDMLFQALSLPENAASYALGSWLRAKFPESFVLETNSGWFRPYEYAKEGLCALKDDAETTNEWNWDWDHENSIAVQFPVSARVKIKWQKHDLTLLTLWSLDKSKRHFLIAKSRQTAEKFFTEVCNWVAEVRAEILIFQDGEWQKSEQLFESIKSASFDNLVLPGKMKDVIAGDFKKFFDSKDTYAKYRIAWKRGVLFIGPPGNGKTHMVKSVVNRLGKPCLYVRNFDSTHQTAHRSIAQVFKRARDTAPCILVLEDLDSLVDDTNRSFFLNEMDGFYSNEGILTLATTNHPEKLDPAILERPSRFDRKYTFALPGFDERKRFIEMYNETLEENLQLNPDAVLQVSWATKDFSYAYLKELFLSAMMSFMAEDTTGTLGGHMISQTDSLREQMRTKPEQVGNEELNGQSAKNGFVRDIA